MSEYHIAYDQIRGINYRPATIVPPFISNEYAHLYSNFTISKKRGTDVHVLKAKNSRKKNNYIGRYCVPVRIISDDGFRVQIGALVDFQGISPELVTEV
jgi:hypothetical protein